MDEVILDIKLKMNPIKYTDEIGIETVNNLLNDHDLPELDELELNGYGVRIKEHPYHKWIHVKVWR